MLKANFNFPNGKQMIINNGVYIITYYVRDRTTNQNVLKIITRDSFAQISDGAQGFPPLVRIYERGNNRNVGFIHMWVVNNGPERGLMKWRIGEILEDKTFEEINWRPHSQIPGRKNKGIGNAGDIFQQGLFEASGRWVEFLEHKGYSLLFPTDEVIGNQLYNMRSNNSHILKSDIDIPKCMLSSNLDFSNIPCGELSIERKYDGGRHIAGLHNGEVNLYTRKRTVAKLLHLINDQLKVVFDVMNEITGSKDNSCQFWLDGEMYRHGWSRQTIMSAIRPSVNASQLSPGIVYMVFDLIDNGQTQYQYRRKFLEMVFANERVKALENVSLSENYKLKYGTAEEIAEYANIFVTQGYEGAMLKSGTGLYIRTSTSKRSKDVLKVKDFHDEEGYVLNVVAVEGGDHHGCAKFIVNTNPDGTGYCRPLTAIPSGRGLGELEIRRQIYLNKELFIGRRVTYKYQIKSDEGIPLHANVIEIDRQDIK